MELLDGGCFPNFVWNCRWTIAPRQLFRITLYKNCHRMTCHAGTTNKRPQIRYLYTKEHGVCLYSLQHKPLLCYSLWWRPHIVYVNCNLYRAQQCQHRIVQGEANCSTSTAAQDGCSVALSTTKLKHSHLSLNQVLWQQKLTLSRLRHSY